MARQAKNSKASEPAFPTKVEPMLCSLVREVEDNPDYLYEVKWDGYRIIAYAEYDDVRLASRGGLNYTSKYPLVSEAIASLGHQLILDGEVVILNEKNEPDFDALQKYNGARTPIAYCVFDILWLNGHDLMNFPLIQRKEILKALIADHPVLKFSESYESGSALYEQMVEKGWEGIVAKRKESFYVPGERSSNWLKVPTTIRQEFVIGAWAESENNRLFKSLLFGAYNNEGKLEWIGRSGGGYKHKEMPEIMKRLKALETDKSPFVNKVLDTKGAVIHYIKPELVANFAFATWTKTGRIRKPATFLGFREDKNPKDVVREVPKENPAPLNVQEKNTTSNPSTPETVYLNEDSNWKDIDKIEIEEERELPIDGFNVKVYDIGRVLWEDREITKAELMSYYALMANWVLPYLKNRPLSIYLKHIAPTAPGLYVKDMEGRQPEYAEIFSTERKHKKKGKRNVIEYLVCNNSPTLLYLINLGAIDLNPWSSRIGSPDQPDYITIDLDPSDGDFNKAIETALAAKELFDKLGLTAFPKTSGKTGIHLLIPCEGFNFAEARKLGSYICDEVQKLVPEISTRERSVEKRGDLLYVDDSQNDFADTIASAYSVRPYHSPTVSTPLKWKEVNQKLDPAAFTMDTIKKRLDKEGDLFQGVFDEKIRLYNSNILKNL